MGTRCVRLARGRVPVPAGPRARGLASDPPPSAHGRCGLAAPGPHCGGSSRVWRELRTVPGRWATCDGPSPTLGLNLSPCEQHRTAAQRRFRQLPSSPENPEDPQRFLAHKNESRNDFCMGRQRRTCLPALRAVSSHFAASYHLSSNTSEAFCLRAADENHPELGFWLLRVSFLRSLFIMSRTQAASSCWTRRSFWREGALCGLGETPEQEASRRKRLDSCLGGGEGTGPSWWRAAPQHTHSPRASINVNLTAAVWGEGCYFCLTNQEAEASRPYGAGQATRVGGGQLEPTEERMAGCVLGPGPQLATRMPGRFPGAVGLCEPGGAVRLLVRCAL